MTSTSWIQDLKQSIRYILLLMVESAGIVGANSKSDNAAAGGTFNYRTDALDDGADPAGWYDDD
jgi:hypothetical protein